MNQPGPEPNGADARERQRDDPLRLQRLLDRRGFLGVSGLAAGVLIGAGAGYPSPSYGRATAAVEPKVRLPSGDSVDHPPFSASADCVLSEDHFMIKTGQIDPATDEVMAYSRADGQVEAITLQDDTVWQIRRNPAVAGGWDRRQVAAGATDVVAGVAPDADGKLSLDVFYRTAANTVKHLREQPPGPDGVSSGQFTPLETLDWTSVTGALQITADVAQNLLVFALAPSRDGFASLAFYWTGAGYAGADPEGGILSGFDFEGDVKGGGASAVITYAYAAFGGQPTLMVYCPSSARLGVDVSQYSLPLQGNTAISANMTAFAHQPPDFEPPFADYVFPIAVDYLFSPGGLYLPAAVIRTEGGELYTLTHDYEHNLWRLQQLPAPSVPEGDTLRWEPSNISVQSGAIFKTNNVLNMFVVVDGTLSVLRQVDQGDAQSNALTPVFNYSLPLQPGIARAVSQARPSTGDELIAVGLDGNLQVMTKSADGSWIAGELDLPADEPAQVSTYRVQLTATDSWGTPAAGRSLQLTTDSPAIAFIDGQGLTLSATPTALSTDASGQLTIPIVADGLFAPNLTVSADWLAAPLSVSPSGPINRYMAGTDTVNFLPAMSGGTLAGALDGQGKPVFPLASDHSDIAADSAKVLATAASAALPKDNLQGAAGAAGASGASGASAQHHSHRHRSVAVGSKPSRLGGPVDLDGAQLDFSKLTHDALYAIKTGAAKVSEVVIDIADNYVATFTADFEAWAQQEVQVVITDLVDAAHVFHAVINHLEAVLDDVIDWLKAHVLALLSDTVKLAAVYEGWMLQMADQLRDLATQAKGKSDQFFAGLKPLAHDELGQLKTLLGNVTIDSLVHGQQLTQRSTLGDSNDDAALDPASPSSRWLLSKLTQAGPAATREPTVSGDLENALQDLEDKLGESAGDFVKAAKDFATAVTTLVSNPKTFGTVGVDNLIDALDQLIDTALDLADLVTDVVIDFVIAGIDLFKDLISISVSDLPLVSPLLKAAGMTDPMTVGRLITLVLAFPSALAYKVRTGDGGAVLFTPQLQEERHLLGSTEAERLAIASAVVTIVVGTFDGLAAFGNGVTKGNLPDFFAWVDMVGPMVVGGLTFPAHDGGLPFSSAIRLKDREDVLTVLDWMIGCLISVIVTARVYLARDKPDPIKDAIGDNMLVVTTLDGAVGAVMAVLVAFLGADSPDAAKLPAIAGLLGNVSPGLGIFLRTDAIAATDGVSAILTAIIGYAATLASAIISVAIA